jgi:sugar lactone lactonase YvrE
VGVSPPSTNWEVAFADDAQLAEHPLWDERGDVVLWVDINAGRVHRLDMDGRHDAAEVGAPLGAAALRAGGGLLVARGDGVAFLGPDGTPDRDEIPFRHPANVRFNDGACDPFGRFLIGTCSTDGSEGRGALYSVAPDGAVSELLSGVTESNGLAWSLDGRTLFYVDSGEPCLRAYPYDPESGRLGDRRDIVRFGAHDGTPDGLVADGDGAVWVALWGGACVRRYSPAGELLARLETPVSQPSCPAFGGPELDRLYVATAWEGMSEEQHAREPLAGSLLVCRPGVTGRPGARFAG